MDAQPHRIEPDQPPAYGSDQHAEAARRDSLSMNLPGALLALMPEGAAVVNGAGEYVMVSPGFTRHFG